MNSNTSTIGSLESRSIADSALRTTSALRAWGSRLGLIIWVELQAFGARRAWREMRLMGLTAGVDPSALAAHKTHSARPDKKRHAGRGLPDAAKQTEFIRALAMRRMATEPGYAADLLAAADRHETATNASASPKTP